MGSLGSNSLAMVVHAGQTAKPMDTQVGLSQCHNSPCEERVKSYIKITKTV